MPNQHAMQDRSKLIAQVAALRTFYAADNRVGMALDALLADMEKGKLRKKAMREARAVQELIGRTATAHRFIDRIVAELSA